MTAKHFLFSLMLLLTLVSRAQEQSDDLYYLGSVAYYEERYADAERHFRNAIAADPNDAFSTAYLGATLLQLGDKDNALKMLVKGIEMLPPDNLEYEIWARDQITDVLLAKKDTVNALLNMQKILDMPLTNEQQLDLKVRYGTYFYKMGQKTRALELFKELVDWFPESFEARSGLAAALNANKEYDASLAQWNKAVELSQNSDDRFDAIFNRTKTYVNAGQYNAAIDDALTILHEDFRYGTGLLDIVAYYDENTVANVLRSKYNNGTADEKALMRDAMTEIGIPIIAPNTNANAGSPTAQNTAATNAGNATTTPSATTAGEDLSTAMPEYPGGSRAMRKFIRENLQYPHEAASKGLQETVVLNCEIDETGNVTNATISRCQNKIFEEEAIRLAKMLKFIPGKLNGQPVGATKQVEIPFLIRHSK